MGAAARQQEWPDSRQFRPRAYQEPFMGALVSGAYRHFVQVINRRAGKDKMTLNATIEKMQQRVGNYVHAFPTLVEGRENLWENIDGSGFPVIEHFPKELLAAEPNHTYMRVRLKNGSTWRVGGANKPDSIRGGNPVGFTFSEAALMKPSVRFIVDPILRENAGWEVYIFTPKGPANWASKLYQINKDNPLWFCDVLTNDETHTYSAEELADMRRSGVPEEWIQQEIYCSFAAAMVGSYYGRQIEELERAGRVGEYPWQPDVPVDIALDIGIGLNDATAIWFVQTLPGGFNWIDYYETNVEGVHEIARALQEKPYVYRTAVVPHDIKKREWAQAQGAGSGTRLDTFLKLMPVFKEQVTAVGQRGHVVVPAMNPADRINALRRVLRRSTFHELLTADGIEGLKSYRREVDEARSKDPSVPFLKEHPVHDWASHPADAAGHFAVASPETPAPRPEDELPENADIITRMQMLGHRSGHRPWKAR